MVDSGVLVSVETFAIPMRWRDTVVAVIAGRDNQEVPCDGRAGGLFVKARAA